MRQATSTQQKISTADGVRAIRFSVVLTDGARKSVVIDLVRQPEFNGRTYASIESTVLASLVAHGYTAGKIKSFTHDLIA